MYQFFLLFSLKGLPTLQKLDFGLCARVFSAVLTHIEPTIVFSHSPAVSPSKSRNFRFHEPAILFSYCSAVSHSKTRNFRLYEPTIPFLDCSAVSHSKTRDFRFHEPTIPFLTSQRFPIPLPVMTSIDQSEARIRTQTSPHYY